MKLDTLFKKLAEFTMENNSNLIFENSGMINKYAELDYGFFPLGSGVLTNKSIIAESEISPGGVMVLGNDFGTITYLMNECKGKIEENSNTIRNLKRLNLKLENTFFTNLFLGLRDDIKYPETTMTKRSVSLKEDYKTFCFQFLIKQLEIVNPKIVICLGHDVRIELVKKSYLFSEWKCPSFSKLFEGDNFLQHTINTKGTEFGDRTFFCIPHPSFAPLNWSKYEIINNLYPILREGSAS